jgi:hypothetical protein
LIPFCGAAAAGNMDNPVDNKMNRHTVKEVNNFIVLSPLRVTGSVDSFDIKDNERL